jgi:hypothetical protein
LAAKWRTILSVASTPAGLRQYASSPVTALTAMSKARFGAADAGWSIVWTMFGVTRGA